METIAAPIMPYFGMNSIENKNSKTALIADALIVIFCFFRPSIYDSTMINMPKQKIPNSRILNGKTDCKYSDSNRYLIIIG